MCISLLRGRLAILLVLLLPMPLVAAAAGVPPDIVLTPVASGLSSPTALVAPDDGSGRLFVVENDFGVGRIRIIDSTGALLPTPYYSHAITGGPFEEQGMLGLAFDPGFATNGTLYVTFTAPAGDPRLGVQPDQVLLRLVASDPAANVFAGSEQDVLRIPDILISHNGGNIVFGADGYLYWGMGDGGSGDPNGFAQELWKKVVGGKTYYLLGKLLRLDVRNPVAAALANQCGATPGQPAQYSIPADNPFAAEADKCGEIWLWGLRNPWRWSFDRDTGDLVIGDVGEYTWEEIDFRAAGDTGNRNFGWNSCEGNHYYSPPAPGTDCPATTGTVAPVVEYGRSLGSSATGGYVYRGPVVSLRGSYIFGDGANGGRIWFADVDPGMPSWNFTEFAAHPGDNVFSFGEDTAGNAYVVFGSGSIGRFDSTDQPLQWVVTPAAGPGGVLDPPWPQTVNHGDIVEFEVYPAAGYAVDAVSGCGGALFGSTYTTGPIAADCTVTAHFLPDSDLIFRNGFD